jgi:hypothetical protein
MILYKVIFHKRNLYLSHYLINFFFTTCRRVYSIKTYNNHNTNSCYSIQIYSPLKEQFLSGVVLGAIGVSDLDNC